MEGGAGKPRRQIGAANWRLLGYLRFAQAIARIPKRELGRYVAVQSRTMGDEHDFESEYEGAAGATKGAWECIYDKRLDAWEYPGGHIKQVGEKKMRIPLMRHRLGSP